MSPKRTMSRNRTLSACTTCQSRRVKCMKKPGERQCEQCQRSNLDCVIRPDGRRRQVSSLEVDSLRSRLQSLESMLRSQSGTAPSTSMSPRAQSDQPGTGPSTEWSPGALREASLLNPAESIGKQSTSNHNDYVNPGQAAQPNQYSNSRTHMTFSPDRHESSSGSSSESPLADIMSEGPSKVLIDRLISSNHSVVYDPSSGRLRHSCPIIGFHQFSGMNAGNATPGSREQDRRVERVLRNLSVDTYDHLMECFWSYYDPVMQVVDREIFEEDRKMGGALTYSGFLHICILAMGYRYADVKRPDIQKLTLANKESTLHREAKYLVEFEFEKPGGIPSVQALLILGQLESGSGRDAVGSMYAGLAFRFALDIGLNLDCSTFTKREREFRSFVLRACTAFDRLWAIYLGRSTCLKNSDLSRQVYPDRSQQFQVDYSQATINSEKSVETECFDALLDLLELSANIVELLYSKPSPLQHSEHLFVLAGLDAGLKTWYSQLPESLAWTEKNAETAPLPYFHLHSQYHASSVLLHRPFALYEQSKSETGNSDMFMNSLSTVSRAVCIEHTLKTVQVLSVQFQRFEPIRFPQAQLQHIGTAVAALISAAAVSRDPNERARLLKSLHTLAELARAISPTYIPAELISNVLDNLLKEPGWDYKQVASTEGDEVMKDIANNMPTPRDDLFKNSMVANESTEIDPSLRNVNHESSFTFDRDDALEMLSRFGEGNYDFSSRGALGSALDGLSTPPSQQTEAFEAITRMLYAT
ncbi:hypothetical protein K432DRAFT_358583 [Lepidopterella palustris CBS 459.81]|uniref:Zn(2)-C6 fungal-type domain-containing protein n=1 Tax=Lepidopterella palustris CBS 459.81 TaxID=1314670 RepID=A0A8E2E4V7_9PEZI|nr:hypothetical protein K432DRAFT_358583 [Lepidopterella palustris CBS 459.81]